MVAAPDAQWVEDHAPLIPILWGLAVLFGLSSMASTRWFRTLINRLGPETRTEPLATTVPQNTTGSNSPNIWGNNNRVVNNYASAMPEPIPEQRRGIKEKWNGYLQAAAQLPFAVGKSSYVLVVLSREQLGHLEAAKRKIPQVAQWGPTKEEPCSVPFIKTGEEYEPTSVRIELVALDQGISCDNRRVDFDLNWGQEPKELPFQVSAKAPGRYDADIIIWAERKHITAISLHADARVIEEPPKRPHHKDYLQIAKMRVTLEITRQYTKEQSKSLEREHGNSQGNDLGYGNDQGGHSM